MIHPHLQDDDFLDDVRSAPAAEGLFHVWWLGQSGYLIRWNERHLLVDPYLSDSLTNKYARTDKPHIRMTDRVVDPARLDFVDVVSSSHNHTDHLDPETLAPLVKASSGIEIVAPAANLDLVSARCGVAADRPTGVVDGATVEVSDFRFTGVAAAHNELETDEKGRHLFLGYVICFGPFTIYHSGDTLLHEGLLQRLLEHRIDLALLPINGNAPERRVAGNLWGHEAARLAKDAGARLVVPCHYDMFSFNTVTPDAFVQTCWRLNQRHRVLRPGERWSSFELAVQEGPGS